MENQYYQEIMKLPGMEGLKDSIRKWHILSAKRKMDKTLSSKIPAMLWISPPGIGKDHILEAIAEYLYKQNNIIEFCGNKKYIEFICECNPNDKAFSELKRLHETKNHAAGRKSEYKGILCIDISKWIGNENEEHFTALLSYLANECKSILVILSITTEKNTDTRKIERVISDNLRTEKVILEVPETDALMNYVNECLTNHNMVLGSDAKEIIYQSVETLRENGFSGYKALDNLCEDIVYHAMTESVAGKVITQSIAGRFSKDSEYIANRIYQGRDKSIIGFGGGRDEDDR